LRAALATWRTKDNDSSYLRDVKAVGEKLDQLKELIADDTTATSAKDIFNHIKKLQDTLKTKDVSIGERMEMYDMAVNTLLSRALSFHIDEELVPWMQTLALHANDQKPCPSPNTWHITELQSILASDSQTDKQHSVFKCHESLLKISAVLDKKTAGTLDLDEAVQVVQEWNDLCESLKSCTSVQESKNSIVEFTSNVGNLVIQGVVEKASDLEDIVRKQIVMAFRAVSSSEDEVWDVSECEKLLRLSTMLPDQVAKGFRNVGSAGLNFLTFGKRTLQYMETTDNVVLSSRMSTESKRILRSLAAAKAAKQELFKDGSEVSVSDTMATLMGYVDKEKDKAHIALATRVANSLICTVASMENEIKTKLINSLEDMASALSKVKFPEWVLGNEDVFLKAADVNSISQQASSLIKGLKCWITASKLIGIALTDDEEKTISTYCDLRGFALSYLSTYTVTLLLESDGWDQITPEVVKAGGKKAELWTTLDDTMTVAKETKGIKLPVQLQAAADLKLGKPPPPLLPPQTAE
jgi:hypothetical protein